MDEQQYEEYCNDIDNLYWDDGLRDVQPDGFDD